jgi:hypothetical protein
MKLSELFLELLENVNFCHFPYCDLLHKDGSVSASFLNARAIKVIDSLHEIFQMRFNDFRAMLQLCVPLKTNPPSK